MKGLWLERPERQRSGGSVLNKPNLFSSKEGEARRRGGGTMLSAANLPPQYAYLEGCAGLGGHIATISPRRFSLGNSLTLGGAGCRGFCAAFGFMLLRYLQVFFLRYGSLKRAVLMIWKNCGAILTFSFLGGGGWTDPRDCNPLGAMPSWSQWFLRLFFLSATKAGICGVRLNVKCRNMTSGMTSYFLNNSNMIWVNVITH